MTDPNLSESLFSLLLTQHEGILWKVAYAWSDQAADREDLVQEMRLQLWRAFPRCDPQRPFTTWMYRIALNVAISGKRSRQRESLRRLPYDQVPEPMARQADVDLMAQSRELFEVIERLQDADRALLLLYLDDYTHAEIAEVIGITESNVAMRLSRLRQKLRTHVSSSKSEAS